MNRPPATPLQGLMDGGRSRQRTRRLVAGLSAAVVTAASVLLLGLSGWFLTAASAAGLAGAAAATAFNALLPSAGIRLLAILRTGSRYAERLSGHDAALRTLAAIRPALFRALAAAAPAHAMAMPVGDATARMVQDVGEVEVALVHRSSVWAAWAAGLSGFCLLLVAGGRCAAALVAILAAVLLAARLLAARMDAQARDVAPANGALKQEFSTLIAAASELRAYGLEEWAAGRIDTRSIALVTAQRRVTAFGGWFELLLGAGGGLAAMTTLVTAGLTDDAVPLPVTALAMLGAVMTVDGLGGVVRAFCQRGMLHGAETRLNAMLHPRCSDAGHAASMMAWPPAIELRDGSAPRPVTLLPGTVAGLRGPSGCGKTTLIGQLLGLREAVHGRVRLGGMALEDLDPDLVRSCFAAAPQDAALLAGSIRDNLLLADPAATDEQLLQVLHDAALDARVRGLPHGLDTWIGENGARLSGGERRRLVLARALLRSAPWLLLDEPTEGLDAGTEAAVVERLRVRLLRTRQGALIISHRPALLAGCDLVIGMGPDGLVLPRDRRLRPAA